MEGLRRRLNRSLLLIKDQDDQITESKVADISTFEENQFEELNLSAKDFKLRDITHTQKYAYQPRHNTAVCIIV